MGYVVNRYPYRLQREQAAFFGPPSERLKSLSNLL